MFSPLPFVKQVEEASSAVEVNLEKSNVFKNGLGMIMTEYTFNVLESFNVSENDLESHKLKLTMPGGTLNGVTSMIDGAPQFNNGEKSFLLLKKIDSKIYLSNFSLGKYKIQNFDGMTYYVSEVFPSDQNIGKISKDKMVELMKNQWKISISVPSMDSDRVTVSTSEVKPVFEIKKKVGRSVAEEDMPKEGIPLSFWLAIFIFSSFFAFIFFKLGKNGDHYKRE